VLPELERLLLPLGARPHWGKCFSATRPEIAAAYPMLDRFRQLRDRSDPTRKFDNAFLDRVL
ncbi:MAG: D-arabinono-1,4-lactone oxidase, partial [Nocardioides sp.]